MQAGSSDVSTKDCRRIAGVLQRADLHTLKGQVSMHDHCDLGVSWAKDACQFHLIARHRNGLTTWHLLLTKGMSTLPVFQTTESSIDSLFSIITGKTTEIAKAEMAQLGAKARMRTTTDIELASAFQAQPGDAEWMECLIRNKIAEGDGDEKRLSLLTRAFSQDGLSYVSGLSQVYNTLAGDELPIMIITDMGDVEEQLSERDKKRTYSRWRVTNSHWCLSARAHNNTFELFLVHAADGVALSAAETEVSRQVQLQCTLSGGIVTWWHNKLPLNASEMRLLMKAAFAEMVRRTLADLEEKRTGRRPSTSLSAHETEKQQLAQKIIIQQEQLQKRIARDLHDAVIADITMLKRGLNGECEDELSTEKVIESLDQISTRLRDICYDLSPTDLRDWGLRTTLEALVDQASQHTKANCTFICDDELPEFDDAVQLHVYRILQESINNVVKYAKAQDITVSVERQGEDLVFLVKDDGKGIDFTAAMKQARQGGMGMSGMQERVGIIKSYYPASLNVISKPGRGTVTKLSIQVPAVSPPRAAKKAADEPTPSPLELLAAED